MRINSLQLCQRGFRLDSRKNFFTERMKYHWNRLPREAVESLKIFNRHMDMILRDMV